MNKYILILLLTCFCLSYPVNMNADSERDVLLVQLKNGDNRIFRLNEKPVLKFVSTNVVVSTTNFEGQFDFKEVRSIKFVNAEEYSAGITLPTAQLFSLTYRDNESIRLTGEDIRSIKVYNLKGQSCPVNIRQEGNGVLVIDISSLSAGVYLIKAGHATYKISKK